MNHDRIVRRDKALLYLLTADIILDKRLSNGERGDQLASILRDLTDLLGFEIACIMWNDVMAAIVEDGGITWH